MRRGVVEPPGRRLGLLARGEAAPRLLLLHGAAGRASEWSSVLTELGGHSAVAVDLPCHGIDAGGPVPRSREALMEILVDVLERHVRAPAVLVGQSLGGVAALLTAAARPDLVAGLVLVEATPGPAPGAAAAVRAWLDGWPMPFASLANAYAWFRQHDGASKGAALAFLDTLVEDTDGWRRRVITDDVVFLVDLLASDGCEEAWRRVGCPTLAIGGGRSWLPPENLVEMTAGRDDVRLDVLEGAGHNVHLDAPAAVAAVVEYWLADIAVI